MYHFLDSNFFQTLIILLTGVFVFMIFILQKADEKKKAAIIIINEIRNAEDAINNIKTNRVINKLIQIMPVNSWSKYNYLFVAKLDQDEYSLISDFYSKCEQSEKAKNNFFKIMDDSIAAKANHIQVKLIEMISDSIKGNSFQQDEFNIKKTIFINETDRESHLFNPLTPRNEVIDFISNITLILPTSSGLKLKNIAKIK